MAGRCAACIFAFASISCRGAPAAKASSPTVAAQPDSARASVDGQVASSAPARRGEVAAAWLDALRRRDLPALTTQSRYPFELRDTRAEGNCDERRTAANA